MRPTIGVYRSLVLTGTGGAGPARVATCTSTPRSRSSSPSILWSILSILSKLWCISFRNSTMAASILRLNTT